MYDPQLDRWHHVEVHVMLIQSRRRHLFNQVTWAHTQRYDSWPQLAHRGTKAFLLLQNKEYHSVRGNAVITGAYLLNYQLEVIVRAGRGLCSLQAHMRSAAVEVLSTHTLFIGQWCCQITWNLMQFRSDESWCSETSLWQVVIYIAIW